MSNSSQKLKIFVFSLTGHINMDKSKLKIGDILKVTQGIEVHYEKVIQIAPEVLTEDMPTEKDADVSIQDISDNLNYELIENHQIANMLHNYIPKGIAFRIADRFSDYRMEHSTFDNALKDLGW